MPGGYKGKEMPPVIVGTKNAWEMCLDAANLDLSKQPAASHRKRHALKTAIALGILVLSALPLGRSVGSWESDAFFALNGLPGWIFPPVWLAMQAGNLLAVPFVAAVALSARRIRLSLDLSVAGLSAWFLATLIKALVERARPAELLQDVILRGAPRAGHGFVSGHAAVAASLAAAVAPYLSKRWKAVVWLVAAIVAFGRVYVGAHLPLDVVGGAAMGWAIGSLVHVALGEPEGASGDGGNHGGS